MDPYDLNMTLKEIKEIEAAEEEKEQLILKMSRWNYIEIKITYLTTWYFRKYLG